MHAPCKITNFSNHDVLKGLKELTKDFSLPSAFHRTLIEEKKFIETGVPFHFSPLIQEKISQLFDSSFVKTKGWWKEVFELGKGNYDFANIITDVKVYCPQIHLITTAITQDDIDKTLKNTVPSLELINDYLNDEKVSATAKANIVKYYNVGDDMLEKLIKNNVYFDISNCKYMSKDIPEALRKINKSDFLNYVFNELEKFTEILHTKNVHNKGTIEIPFSSSTVHYLLENHPDLADYGVLKLINNKKDFLKSADRFCDNPTAMQKLINIPHVLSQTNSEDVFFKGQIEDLTNDTFKTSDISPFGIESPSAEISRQILSSCFDSILNANSIEEIYDEVKCFLLLTDNGVYYSPLKNPINTSDEKMDYDNQFHRMLNVFNNIISSQIDNNCELASALVNGIVKCCWSSEHLTDVLNCLMSYKKAFDNPTVNATITSLIRELKKKLIFHSEHAKFVLDEFAVMKDKDFLPLMISEKNLILEMFKGAVFNEECFTALAKLGDEKLFNECLVSSGLVVLNKQCLNQIENKYHITVDDNVDAIFKFKSGFYNDFINNFSREFVGELGMLLYDTKNYIDQNVLIINDNFTAEGILEIFDYVKKYEINDKSKLSFLDEEMFKGYINQSFEKCQKLERVPCVYLNEKSQIQQGVWLIPEEVVYARGKEIHDIVKIDTQNARDFFTKEIDFNDMVNAFKIFMPQHLVELKSQLHFQVAFNTCNSRLPLVLQGLSLLNESIDKAHLKKIKEWTPDDDIDMDLNNNDLSL